MLRRTLILSTLITIATNATATPPGYHAIFEGNDGIIWAVHPDVEQLRLGTKQGKSPIILVVADIWMSDSSGNHGTKMAFRCDSSGVQYKVWTREDGTPYRSDTPMSFVRGTAGYHTWEAACELFRRKGQK